MYISIGLIAFVLSFVFLDEWANREVLFPGSQYVQSSCIGNMGEAIFTYNPDHNPLTSLLSKLRSEREARLIHCRTPGVVEVRQWTEPTNFSSETDGRLRIGRPYTIYGGTQW